MSTTISLTPTLHPATPTLLLTARLAAGLLALADAAAVLTIMLRAPRDLAARAVTPFLAYFVIAAIALAFLALHRRATPRPRPFAITALIACAAQALLLVTLLAFLITSGAENIDAPPPTRPILPIPFAVALLALTGATAATAAFLLDRPATEHVLLQTAHRAFSIALWILVGRVLLHFWNRPLDLETQLLPAAFIGFAWSALIPTAILWLHPPDPATRAEARSLAKVGALVLIPTVIWMILTPRA